MGDRTARPARRRPLGEAAGGASRPGRGHADRRRRRVASAGSSLDGQTATLALQRQPTIDEVCPAEREGQDCATIWPTPQRDRLSMDTRAGDDHRRAGSRPGRRRQPRRGRQSEPRHRRPARGDRHRRRGLPAARGWRDARGRGVGLPAVRIGCPAGQPERRDLPRPARDRSADERAPRVGTDRLGATGGHGLPVRGATPRPDASPTPEATLAAVRSLASDVEIIESSAAFSRTALGSHTRRSRRTGRAAPTFTSGASAPRPRRRPARPSSTRPLAKQPAGNRAAAQATPIAVGAGSVDWIDVAGDGSLGYNTADVSEVCPPDDAAGCATLSNEAADSSRLATVAQPKTIIADPGSTQAVVVSRTENGTQELVVVDLPERQVAEVASSPEPQRQPLKPRPRPPP